MLFVQTHKEVTHVLVGMASRAMEELAQLQIHVQVTTATRMLTVLMLATHSRVHVEQATQEMEFSAMTSTNAFKRTTVMPMPIVRTLWVVIYVLARQAILVMENHVLILMNVLRVRIIVILMRFAQTRLAAFLARVIQALLAMGEPVLLLR